MPTEFSKRRLVRKVMLAAALLAVAAIAGIGWMYHVATSSPAIRRTVVGTPGLNSPLRLLLISDVHVAGPDMPPKRLETIVAQLNRLAPDLTLIAGDFVSDKRTATRTYPAGDAIAPLAKLKARIGVFAVLGNHDHWRSADDLRKALQLAGIRVLENEHATAGPLTIGGVDDAFTGHDDLSRVLNAMATRQGPRIVLSHSPDIFPDVPRGVILTLAGHTHCGQIRLPFVGAVSTMSAYGSRYACGRVDEAGRTLIVSAGLGTSVLPLRLRARPDVWLIELRPMASAENASGAAPPARP
jgi:predicted MPP superfamily phosphohydrolase